MRAVGSLQRSYLILPSRGPHLLITVPPSSHVVNLLYIVFPLIVTSHTCPCYKIDTLLILVDQFFFRSNYFFKDQMFQILSDMMCEIDYDSDGTVSCDM